VTHIRAEKKRIREELNKRRMKREGREHVPDVSREQRRRELRCFWTFPLGHEWHGMGAWGDTCQICGKTSKTLVY
jgi:hypothetical protein